MFKACNASNYEMISFLIENKFDPNAERLGEFPLVIAIKKHDLHMMEILIDGGANPSKRYTGNREPLYFAYKEKNIQAMKYLLQKGASANEGA